MINNKYFNIIKNVVKDSTNKYCLFIYIKILETLLKERRFGYNYTNKCSF